MPWYEVAASASCGLAALWVYLATLSSGAFPGDSARSVAEAVGLLPRLAPDYPLWASCSRLVAALAGRNAVTALNVFSAVCGAVAVALLCAMVARVVRHCIDPQNIDTRSANAAPVIAGVAAALFLAFSTPFWVVSNRFHMLSFHAALFLAIASVFVTWAECEKRLWLYLWAFLYGIGIAEYAGFIAFAPLFAALVVYLLWCQEDLQWRYVLTAGMIALCGMGLYAVSAWQFRASTGFELREYTSWFDILWYWWRDQFNTLKGSLPSVGWLTILCLTVVPWVAMLASGRMALNRTQEKGVHMLQIVMTALVVVVLLNFKIAPWRMLGFGRLLVMPYILTASLFGYLAAYWFMMPRSWDDVVEEDGKPGWKDWLGWGLAAVLVALTIRVSFENVEEADGRSAGFINRMAGRVVTAAADKQWLVTDGVMDTHLLIAIRDAGLPLKLISYSAGGNKVYANLLGREFTEPRWRNLLELSVPVFVREWLKSDPGLGRRVCVVGDADLWVSVGLAPVPDGFGFVGVSAVSEVDAAGLLDRNARLWQEENWGGVDAFSSRNPAYGYGTHLRRYTALLANNLGVVMEELDRKDDAFKAYGMSRRMDADNVSALLNQMAMIDRGYDTPGEHKIRDQMAALAANIKGRFHVWSLSRHNGYVRLPEAYLQMGWTWALSGMPGVALSGLRKAIEMASGEQRRQAEHVLAYAYSILPQGEESQAGLESLLGSDPSNTVAMVALARKAARRGELDQARVLLEKAEQAGHSLDNLAMEWVGLHLASGSFDKARVILEETVARDSDNLRAWLTLATIHVQQRDEAGVTRCLDNLERKAMGGGYASLVRAEAAAKHNDLPALRRHLEHGLRSMPGNLAILERMLSLDVAERKPDIAKAHAMDILRIRHDHAFANYIMGTIRFNENKIEMAEESFRASLRSQRTSSALNDLAWLLQRKGAYKEAESLAREAVQAEPGMINAWDTLAVVLTKAGRFAEAEQILNAQVARPEAESNGALFLHLAEVQYLQKRIPQAREMLKLLESRRRVLSLEEQVALDSLRLSLSTGG